MLKRGSQGPEVFRFYDYFTKYAASYAFLLGKRDGYYGGDEERFTSELQRRLGVPITGVFGDLEAARTGYRWTGTPTPPVAERRRPIWIYTMPGSGAPGNIGPAYQLGERAKSVLKINHQWVGYPIGGYLGFMGGDPKYSYNDVIGMADREWERLLWANPDVVRAMDARRANPAVRVDVEIWGSAYSQSADAMRRSAARLFGPGGPFELIRDRLNGLILFGDPSTPGTGISGWTFPDWLDRLVTDINYPNDFYAVATDKIRRAMFGIIVEAEMELPFFVHVLRLAMRIMPSWLGLFGGLGSGLAGAGGLLSQANSSVDRDVDEQLYQLLSPTGVLTNIPGLIALMAALPGLQSHGSYEFDPVMMNRAYDVMAGFRR